MFEKIITGISFEMKKKTKPQDSAIRFGSGLVDVFSTPAMIGFMEGTCYKTVENYLPEEFSTVGFEVNIKHLKATPIGMEVKCKAILKKIEGKRLEFDVQAFDEYGLIGEGKHVRYIIDKNKFSEKLKK